MKDDIVKPPSQPESGGQQTVRQTTLAGNTAPISDITPAGSAKKLPESGNTGPSQKQPIERPRPKKSRNSFAIVFAVIILITLTGVAIKAGMDKSSNNKPAQQTVSQQSSEPSESENDQLAIDNSIKEIDSLPNGEDTSGNGLTDSNLGL